MAEAETRTYLFSDSLENEATAWNNSGGTASVSSEGEPAAGGSGSSLRVVADAWSQSGLHRHTTVDADQAFLHFDIYRVPGSDAQLIIRFGDGWNALRLDASNYGLWTIEGVESADDLSAAPAESWVHVTVDLVGLIGAGEAFQAIGVVASWQDGNTYFFDDVYFSNTAEYGDGGTNTAPVAIADGYATDEGVALNVAAGGVLANDTDAEGDALSAALQTGPANGALTLNTDGSFTYTPDAGFAGTDSFTYAANDGTDESAAVTVTIDVNAVNTAPVAVADSFTFPEDGFVEAPAPAILGNDTDADGDALTAVLVSGTTNGELDLAADGSFTYRPNANFHGTDSFTYAASDGQVDSAPVTVSITVAPVNDLPSVAPDLFVTEQDQELVVPAAGVLANDVDADGDVLSAVLQSGPANGTLSLNADGSFAYTPNEGFSGSDSFTYRANDGTGNSVPATVAILVEAGNQAPVTTPDSYTINEDSTVTIFAPGVLADDVDPNGDALTAVLQSGPTNGELTLNADGSFVYAPDADYNGTDSFVYVANDGSLDSDPTTVTITVNPVNDAPVAVSEVFALTEDFEYFLSENSGVLANDTDADGDALSVSLVSDVSNGTLTLSDNGAFTYVPDPGYSGSDSFTYVVIDGSAGSNTATANFLVLPVATPAEIGFGVGGALPAIDPGDVRVNTTTGFGADQESVAAIADGGFVVVWRSMDQDGSFGGIYSQRFGADGAPVGPESLVNVITAGQQVAPAVVALADGGYAVSWWSFNGAAGGYDAYLRIFDSEGNAEGDGSVVSSAASLSFYSHATALPDGGLVLAWRDSDTFEVLAQRIDASGAPVGATIIVSDPLDNAGGILAAQGLADGGFIVAWGVGGGIAYQRFASDGSELGSERLLAGASGERLADPALTATADGGFVIAGTMWTAGGNPLGVHGQRFDSDGAPVGSLFQVSTPTDGMAWSPDVTALPDGGFVVSWVASGRDGDGQGQFAQRFGADGSKIGPDVRLSDTTIGEQLHGTGFGGEGGAVLSDGSFVQMFSGEGDIYFRRFDAANPETAITASEGGAIALPITVTSPEAADVVSQVVLSGLPVGSVLSAGTANVDGSEWTFAGPPPAGLTLTPPAGYDGAFGLTVTATTVDGTSTRTSSATIDVVVEAGPDEAPVGVGDTFEAQEDVALSVLALGVLANDTDDGGSLTARLVDGPTHGTLTLQADGSFDYTPDANFYGADHFNYVANDGVSDSGLTSVTINVRPVNDAPIANGETFETIEDAANTLTIMKSALLANDSDVENDPLDVVLVDGPSNGQLFPIGPMGFAYVPDPNFNGADTFTYVVSDGQSQSETATVTINVTPVNDAPQPQHDAYDAVEGVAFVADVLANDVDLDGDALSIVSIHGVPVEPGQSVDISNTSVVLGADNKLTITPGAEPGGQVTIVYVVSDGQASYFANISVSVSPTEPPAVQDYVFADALADGALQWDNSGATTTLSGVGEPVFGADGASLKVAVDAWSQGGILRSTTIDGDHSFLHLELFKAPGAEGELVLRHGNGWSDLRLDASNYGMWTIDGVASAEDLSALPDGEWAHVTIDLGALLGSGAELQAFGVAASWMDGSTYYFDEVYFSDSATPQDAGGAMGPAAAAAAVQVPDLLDAGDGSAVGTNMFAMEQMAEPFDFSSFSRAGIARETSILQDEPTQLEREGLGVSLESGSFVFSGSVGVAEHVNEAVEPPGLSTTEPVGQMERVEFAADAADGPNLDGSALGQEGLLGGDAFLLE